MQLESFWWEDSRPSSALFIERKVGIDLKFGRVGLCNFLEHLLLG
jgi:hypothetical protein